MMPKTLLSLAAALSFVALPTLADDKCCPPKDATAAAGVKAQKYTCEMHPEVVADKPGNCPKCGMRLEPVKATPKK